MEKNILCLPGLRQNNLFHMVSLQKLRQILKNWNVFAWILYGILTQAGPPRRPHAMYRIGFFAHTFFDVAKKTSSEQRCIWYPYTSGSEKACERSVKKVVRASSDLSVLYTIPLCKTCKIKRSLTVGDFGRHQNACFVHEIIRLPLGIFDFCFFSCFFDEPREKPAPRWVHAYWDPTWRGPWGGPNWP